MTSQPCTYNAGGDKYSIASTRQYTGNIMKPRYIFYIEYNLEIL